MLSQKRFDLAWLRLFQGRPPRNVVVACSAGVDSMVLLDLIFKKLGPGRATARVVYVDHNQRPATEIARDKKIVQNYCHEKGIPLEIRKLELARGASENALRKARYEVLASLTMPGEWLVTAHHADDDLETILFRLLRGAHPDSLSGIQPRAKRSNGLRIARPLLGFTKRDIVKYARLQNLNWSEDSTNRNTRFARNRIRRELIPLLEDLRPGAAGRLASFFRELAQTRAFPTPTRPRIAQAKKGLVSREGGDIRQFDFPLLKKTIDGLLGENAQRTTQSQWKSLKQQLSARLATKRGGGPQKTVQFPCGYALKFKGNRLFWTRENERTTD